MDRRSWLWRRKSTEKSPGETESSIGSISSHSERFSDDQVYLSQNSQSLENTVKRDVHQGEQNHGMKTLSEKLSEALLSINAKEELINQHVKVAEEAVSGWEKAEREVLSLKQQIEVLTVRNSTLEDRVVHLDGALKECMKQLRQTREEKEQIAHEALEKKNSDIQSSLTSIDTDELCHKLETAEKENSDLKLELSSMAEELEIRLIERDLSNQAAEQASKQHLDSIKKVAKLEGECSRLNSALQKANNHQPKASKRPSITENGDLKEMSIFGRSQMQSFVNIDLMDDFLEMEKFVTFHESSELEEKLNKAESLEIVLKNQDNELKESRNQLEKAESKLDEMENELKISRSQFEESESKLLECEKELIASRNQLQESESKLVERENELKGSRDRIKKYENELKASRCRLEQVESKLTESKNELKASKNRLQKCEFKLAERENELKESIDRIKDYENELKASRYRLEQVESKLAESKNELNTSRNRLEEVEFKLAETESGLEMAEAGLEATYMKKFDAEARCKALEAELEILFSKVESLENDLQKERDLSKKAEAKCQELKDEVSRLENEIKGTKSVNRVEELQFLRVKQETELAMAGSKFAACQKTIASLSRQLEKLATLDDFLMDMDDS